jgi:hypothetical protein
VRPIFLPRVPLMNPRTLWACHPVAFMTSASVAPPFRSSSATTLAVLLPSRTPSVLAVLAFLGALPGFLAGVAFLVVAWAFAGAPLGACAPRLAFLPAFGFAGSASGLAASPSPWIRSQMRLAALLFLKRLHRGNARQAIPDAYQALGGPTGDQFRQFLLAGKSIERGGGCGGGLFCGAKRRDVVVVVNRKRRHNRSPWCHALRGHHMDHSGCAHRQANNAGNRERRWEGDEWDRAQMIAGDCR